MKITRQQPRVGLVLYYNRVYRGRVLNQKTPLAKMTKTEDQRLLELLATKSSLQWIRATAAEATLADTVGTLSSRNIVTENIPRGICCRQEQTIRLEIDRGRIQRHEIEEKFDCWI